MARPLSIDLRERVVDAVVRQQMSCRQAAARFGVGVSTSVAWVARYRETGSVAEAACSARVARDPAFAAEVARWRGTFEALDGEFAEAAPPARVLAQAEARLFGRPPSLAARLWDSVGLWRGVAAAAGAVGFFGRPPAPEVAPPLVATVAGRPGGGQRAVRRAPRP